MPAKGSTFDNDLLKLIFNATSIDNIAMNNSASPLTNLYVSLHTDSPGIGGNQTTNEAAYDGYHRVAVLRTSEGWTVSGSTVSPVATIVFPAATGGGETETHFAVGTSDSGSGKILYFGAISPTIAVSDGVTPQLTTSSTITEA
jgi:hypothetical protein